MKDSEEIWKGYHFQKTMRKATEGNVNRADLQNTSPGVTNEKYQCTRNGNLEYWYGNQCLLFQQKLCSGQSRNIWEGEKAPISWHLWDLVENSVEDETGLQSPQQTSITQPRKRLISVPVVEHAGKNSTV